MTTALVVGHSTQASVLMLDFGPTTVSAGNLTNSPYHEGGGGGALETTWNKVGTADVASGLLYADGSGATGVGLNLGAATGGVTTVDLASTPSGSNALGSNVFEGVYVDGSVAQDGIFNGGQSDVTRTGVQITGLAAGDYHVFIVARNTNYASDVSAQTGYIGVGTAGNNFDTDTLISATLAYPAGNNSSSSTWVEEGAADENYIKFTVTLAEGQALNIATSGTVAGGGNRGFLNSIQVATVPEPGSLVLAGLGAAIILARRCHHAC